MMALERAAQLEGLERWLADDDGLWEPMEAEPSVLDDSELATV